LPIQPFLPEGSIRVGIVLPVIDRFSDLQAGGLPTGRCFPALVVSQCLDYGGRSCLPLRDSSGFAPDSLVDNGCRLACVDNRCNRYVSCALFSDKEFRKFSDYCCYGLSYDPLSQCK